MGSKNRYPVGPTGAGCGPLDSLRTVVRELGKVMVAYSGGVDSTLVLAVCLQNLGKGEVTAVVVRHPMLAEGEADEAERRALAMGARVESVSLDPMQIPEVAGNVPDRCYHCKRYLFSHLRRLAAERNVPWCVDGTNADDGEGYRPGIRALEELGIRSPLREVGLVKSRVRALSREAGLETWNRPSAPCLATRFPYNHPLTTEAIRKVDEGERVLRSEGFETLRLRIHGDVARIEVPPELFPDLLEEGRRRRLIRSLLDLGYRYVTMDLAGFRSGSMDIGVTAP